MNYQSQEKEHINQFAKFKTPKVENNAWSIIKTDQEY